MRTGSLIVYAVSRDEAMDHERVKRESVWVVGRWGGGGVEERLLWWSSFIICLHATDEDGRVGEGWGWGWEGGGGVGMG